MLRAPFGEQWSVIQVGVRVGQRVKLKLGMKAARREEFGVGVGGPGTLVPCWSVRGILLEQVTVASQLPACPTKQL